VLTEATVNLLGTLEVGVPASGPVNALGGRRRQVAWRTGYPATIMLRHYSSNR